MSSEYIFMHENKMRMNGRVREQYIMKKKKKKIDLKG